VTSAVRGLRPQLPALNEALVAFLGGAKTTFTRFIREFHEGGDIDRLPIEKLETMFFASTNNINEGALGTLRIAKRLKPNETLHMYNAEFMWKQNETEAFRKRKLNSADDGTWVRKAARARDEAGLPRQDRERQVAAAQAKAQEHEVQEARRLEKQ
ncbi:hypothetical protein BKA70DRAFT_1033166, partial [Coprinopsis sp. MPI-PUGE-AT-0042]